jgi:hypothetical protein
MNANIDIMKAEAISHLKGEKDVDGVSKKSRATVGGGFKVC